MRICRLVFLLVCVGIVGLSLAQENEARGSKRPFDILGASHVVHLRTGTVDVNAEHQRLPRPTPTARRLLQRTSPAPSTSSEWGPLAGAQLWLLTLGSELHVQHGQQQQHHLFVRPSESSWTVSNELEGSGASPGTDFPLLRFRERQSALMKRLNKAGCVVVSFLPPAAWMVVVADQADLGPLIDAYPDIRLAPYGPPGLRVSPELAAALTVLRQAGETVAERLVSGERLDDLMVAAAADQTGWLLGALRLHQPSGGSLAGSGSEPDRKQDGRAHPARLQVEVQFPHLGAQDLVHLAEYQGRDVGAAAGYHPAAAAAADWVTALTALSTPDCPPVLEPDHGSPELLLVAVCPIALEATVQWLAAAPQVSWLAPRMASRLHNLEAGAIVQTGGNLAAVKNDMSVNSHPFWNAGITGKNQMVGCGDSGLDYGNCYFQDESVAVKFQAESNGMPSFTSEQHRKLYYYLGIVQDTVDGYGHGTHVSGTLVGSKTKADPTVDLDVATGQAPAAKIAFMDLSRGNSDSVWTPGDLSASYFNLTYRMGARVHSDSWGSELTVYDSMSAALDRFTWLNQDFLSVFAAGNYGGKSGARTTVTSPAVAKNCIAAGATLSRLNEGSRPSWATAYSMTTTLSLAGGQSAKRSVRVVAASSSFGGDLGSPTLDNSLLVLATPEDACSGLSNAGGVRDKVVLVQRGRCYFTDKVRNAAAAGAKAVIVYNDKQEGGYFQMQAPDGTSTGSINVPLGGVPLSSGLWLKAAIDAGTVSVMFRSVTAPKEYTIYDDIAEYSSFGPTTDGRIKPDIVAPGSLESAAAGTTCGTRASAGTSMATPVIAGSALLVRQYFTDGYYPDGRLNPSAGFVPSGPLIKAVLLGGAVHMKGVVQDSGMPLEDAPSYRQGFGRISLLHSLPLPATTSLGWRLQVVDGARLAQGENHRFCIGAAGGPLRITLAWYDWPGNPAASSVLVNNLDLQVRAAGRGGLLDYGNGVQDSVNTVEQVWYDDLDPGDVAITVSAPVVFASAIKQPYALVVQGKFSGTLRVPSASNPSEDTCAAQVAVIDNLLSTGALVKRKNATFYFSTLDGSTPVSGFECRLSLEGVNSTAWEPCNSPIKYSNKPDGRYTFQVRVRNEQVAAIRLLTIDTVPPVTTLTSTLQHWTSKSSGGDIVTSNDTASFYFVAEDVSTSINFVCKTSFSNGPNGQTAPKYLRARMRNFTTAFVYINVTALGAGFVNCSSPLELTGLSYGDYEVEVMAFDEAKNKEVEPKSVAWKIRYKPDVVYARMESGPLGIIANKSLEYSVVSFRGSVMDGPPESMSIAGQGQQQYQHALIKIPGDDSGAEWSALSSHTLLVPVAQDGNYLVAVRPLDSVDNSTWAMALVQVDTTPPIVNITQGPKPVQVDDRVTIWFGDGGTEGEIRAYYCRWLGPSTQVLDPDTADSGSSAFESCSGKSARNVTDGYWLFQVKGLDAAGNLGSPTDMSFRTDLSDPIISAMIPAAFNLSKVMWNYTVTDGPSGTGVVNISCSFMWSDIVQTGNIVVGDAEYPAGNRSWSTPCPPSPAKYTVQEGIYFWSLATADGAGRKASADYRLVVDFTPPVSQVNNSTLRPGRKLPSRFTVGIASVDQPQDFSSGVAQQHCKIDQVSAPPPVSPPPPPPMLPPGPPLPVSPNSRAASIDSGRSRRRMAQQQLSSVRILDGSEVQLGQWHICDSTGAGLNVTYDGFSSGYYTLSLRAIDLAGNMGEETLPSFFTVDASLPIDGSETVEVGDSGGGSNKTKKIIIGVAVLVGVIVIIASLVGIIYMRRRHLRKHYGAPPPMSRTDAAHSIALQPVAPYANGNGHASIIRNGGQVQAGMPSVVVLQPSSSNGVINTMVASPGMPYYPVIGGVVAGVPATGSDPALAAALVASAAEEAERVRVAAAASAEQERLRQAIAASLEEDNLRRAMDASLSAARQESTTRIHADAEQAAMDAAIAASLATAENEQRWQHSQARAQMQMQQPPSAPMTVRPPDESLI